MSLFVNGIEITSAVFNDIELQKIIFDNVLVWQKTSLNLEEVAAMLIDYDYTIERDTIIISRWKGTLNGENSTISIVPDNSSILLKNDWGTLGASPWRSVAVSNTLTDLIIPDSVTMGNNGSMAYWFGNCWSLRNVSFNHIGVTNMAFTYNNCQNLTMTPSCDPNVIDMMSTYQNCRRLSGSPVCGDKITSMQETYTDSGVSGKAACGNNVITMYQTYRNCYGITEAICGPKVTGMSGTYMGCGQIVEPVCGPNVTTMYMTYQNCNSVINAVCGNNVINMAWAYTNCYNLRNPVCGPKVTNMAGAYSNCYWLSKFVCGNNVTDLSYAYSNTGVYHNTIVIPNKVTNMYSTFDDSNPLGNMYIYSKNIINAENCLANRSQVNILNIYVPANSSTFNAFVDSYIFGRYNNSHWRYNNSGNYYYCNDYFNLSTGPETLFYLYPVDNVVAVRAQNGD